MVKDWTGRPRRVFLLEQLRAAHLEEIVSWIGADNSNEHERPGEQVLSDRMYREFRRQYRPLWCSGEVDSLVMTVNRVPVFCVSLLRIGYPGAPTRGLHAHIYLLCRPQVRVSDRLMLLAWQAVTVHAFLQLGLARVQVAVDADCPGENEALLMLGFRLMESMSETTGRINLYACEKQEMKVVM
jgi:hypothetical protein